VNRTNKRIEVTHELHAQRALNPPGTKPRYPVIMTLGKTEAWECPWLELKSSRPVCTDIYSDTRICLCSISDGKVSLSWDLKRNASFWFVQYS
jgi:hypothetical protein